MIQTNSIVTETSSSILGKEKGSGKGVTASKGLFSSLLNILQKGKQGNPQQNTEVTTNKQQNNQDKTSKESATTKTVSLVLTNKQTKATTENITPAALPSKTEKTVAMIDAPLAIKNVSDSDGSDVIAVAQETIFTPQNNLLAKNTPTLVEQSEPMTLAKNKKQATTVLEQKNNLQPPTSQLSSAKKTMNQPQNIIPNLTPEAPLTKNKPLPAMTLTTQEQRVSNKIVAEKVIVEKVATDKTMDNKQIVSPTSDKNTTTLTSFQQTNSPTLRNPNQTEQPPTSLQNKQMTSDADPLSDGLKAAQSPLAALQQRANPNQQIQPNNTVAAANTQSSLNITTADSNTSSSQQDLSSNQQNVDLSLLESKAESKGGKGLDFQAQLAYKSQRAFTPADTMLEIVRSAKTGSTSLELQLEPANLGKVQVSIQIDAAKQIQVLFTVDQAASKHALEQQMPQLRLAMAQQGLDLSGFSMQMNQQGGQQSGSQTRQDASSDATGNATALNNQEGLETRIGVNMATHGHLSILA